MFRIPMFRKPRNYLNVIEIKGSLPNQTYIPLSNYITQRKLNWYIWKVQKHPSKKNSCKGCHLQTIYDCTLECKKFKDSICIRVLEGDTCTTILGNKYKFVITDGIHMEAVKI